MTPDLLIQNRIVEHQDVANRMPSVQTTIEEAASLLVRTLASGNKVLVCGNGGSASDAQHIAGELVGRFLIDRAPLAAIALTTDSAILTAVGNDYGFDQVFSRQVGGLGVSGDLLWCLSTSGNSANVMEAVKVAKAKGMSVLGFTGEGGGLLKDECTVCLQIPSTATPRIQEMHILVAHILCEVAEDSMKNHPLN